MNEKQLYQQQRQAQLDQWKAEVDKFRAKAASASATVQLGLNEQIKVLEKRIEESKAKLVEIAAAPDDAWESIKESAESAWTSLKSAFNDTASKFKG